jgi:ABC-type tungstate transport system permease subunit
MHKILALLAGPLAAAALLLTPALASADTSSSLTVVGTSDVSDSGLVANLIQPDFKVEYPQFTFKYVGTATGTAITDAETGSLGASVLIVHAASLENQFVANGYSYNNQYGYAIFRNDFVLAGPASDPAGVASNGANNVAQAFADVAAAGIAGKATFVSRGGTPGTTIQEHQFWALVQANNLGPAGLLLCTLSATNGGGETPIAAGDGVTASGQSCPGNGALLPAADLPSWYVTTGLTQGPNIVFANACTGTGAISIKSGGGSCYVFTDRGTYDYLASGLDPNSGSSSTTPTDWIPGLTIVTRGPQATTAPGGVNELANFFHAYIINPTKPDQTVNLAAAQDLITMLTSPSFQAQLKNYLNDTTDPGGPPFVADASPVISEIGLPTTSLAGKAITVTGTVANAEPGYAPIVAQTITVDEIVAGVPVAVASAKTNTDGTFSVKFTPRSSGEYQLSTGQISQVENSTLSPAFGDILSPAATPGVFLTLSGLPTAHSLSFKKVSQHKGKVTVSGGLSPAPEESGAKVELFALNLSTGSEKKIGTAGVGTGKTTFSVKGKLSRHVKYALQLEYLQKGQTSIYSGLKKLSVT